MTASAIRGVQCFMPVNTEMPSSRSSEARLGDRVQRRPVLDPKAPVPLDEVREPLWPDRAPAPDVRVVRRHVFQTLR